MCCRRSFAFGRRAGLRLEPQRFNPAVEIIRRKPNIVTGDRRCAAGGLLRSGGGRNALPRCCSVRLLLVQSLKTRPESAAGSAVLARN